MRRHKPSCLTRMHSWGFALLVCVAGIACLVRDSWPRPIESINFHAVFGVLLWIMVVVKFHQRARSSSLADAEDFRLVSRQLSRSVYILLYVVFGAEQVIRAGAIFWNSVEFGASRPAIPQPPENLRDFLVYGIVALV